MPKRKPAPMFPPSRSMRDLRLPVPVELADDLAELAGRYDISRVALVRAVLAAFVDRPELADGPGATRREVLMAEHLIGAGLVSALPPPKGGRR